MGIGDLNSEAFTKEESVDPKLENQVVALRLDFPTQDAYCLPTYRLWTQYPGRIWGIIGQDPSDSKSNRHHVEIFRFLIDWFRYILQISSKMMGNFPEVLNFNRLFLKVNRFVCN